MRQLTQDEIEIIRLHNVWLSGHEGGRRANLSGANLSGADLYRADLYGANLSGADLSGANLSGANLSRADLSGANLSGADLFCAKFTRVNLQGADLRGAKLDFSAWPLHCGSTCVRADDRLVSQLLYHVTMLDVSGCSPDVRDAVEKIRGRAVGNMFPMFRHDVAEHEEFSEPTS